MTAPVFYLFEGRKSRSVREEFLITFCSQRWSRGRVLHGSLLNPHGGEKVAWGAGEVDSTKLGGLFSVIYMWSSDS